MPQKGSPPSPPPPGGRAGSPAAHWILAAHRSGKGCWYLHVFPRQIGVAEGWLWVHGLMVHVPQRRDKDEVGAGATLPKTHQKGEKNERG